MNYRSKIFTTGLDFDVSWFLKSYKKLVTQIKTFFAFK